MTHTLLAGLSLIDSLGLAILATTLGTLVLGILTNFALRARYASLEKDLRLARGPDETFSHPVLDHIVRDAMDASRRSGETNTQAIIEEHFQSELGGSLLAERFVRAATGLVIILGLLGTFYGLTLSIGKIVNLVAAESGVGADITQGVTQGLTQALSGMAVAFSNSLVGVLSAVILTVIGVLSNVADQRTGLMVQIETALDRILPQGMGARGDGAGMGNTVARLDGAVARFESALQAFASTTGDFHQFNAHLKDNVQRMSLSFGELSDTLKTHVAALRRGGGV